MKKELPARPSLEHLKAQAKDLLRDHARGDEGAIERVRAALPSRATTIALHDAQSVIAREYGFASFQELHAHVEAMLPRETVAALMGQLPEGVAAEIARASARVPAFTGDVPPKLPLVAMRNALLTAGAVAPLHLGRPSSIAAVEAARRGDGLVAIFAQKDVTTDAPAAEDLHPVGCAAEIVSFGDGWLVVRAARWIRLDVLEPRDAFTVAHVSELTIRDGGGDDVAHLHHDLRARVDALLATLPGGARLAARTASMSPLELADAVVANMPWPLDEKARYAETLELASRLRFVLGLISPKG